MDSENGARNNSVLTKAKQALDEQLDPVKKMNQMISFAKVQTILDLQKDEKALIRKQLEDQDRQMDAMMESERVKALSIYEQREEQRLKELRSGSLVVIDQIKDGEKRRLREEEQRAKERLFALRQIEEDQRHQESLLEEKRLAQQRMLAQVLEVNAAVTQQKEAAMMRDKVEELKLLEYQRQRDMKERQREESLAAEAAKREAEITKLRSMQERSKDKAVEIDALRAKRAIEAAERAARDKDRMEAARLERINASLAEARKVQRAEKQLMLIQQAREEKVEFDRLVSVQIAQEEDERARAEAERDRLDRHAKELRNQIEAAHEKKAQERRDCLEEGSLVRAQLEAERKRLEAIRVSKLDLLRKAGVPEKHCTTFKKSSIL